MRKFMFLKDTCLCCLDEGTMRGVWTLTLGRVKINLCDYHARSLKKSTLRTDFDDGKVCISSPAQGKWIKCRLPFIRKCSV